MALIVLVAMSLLVSWARGGKHQPLLARAPKSTFGLSNVLEELREELKDARAKAIQDGAFGMYLHGVDVELSFTVGSSEEGEGAIEVEVLGAGAKVGGKRAARSETVHRILLTFTPEMSAPGNDADGIRERHTVRGQLENLVKAQYDPLLSPRRWYLPQPEVPHYESPIPEQP